MDEPRVTDRDARREDWGTKPMPDSRTNLDVEIVFSERDLTKVRRGVIPREMEDKWFVYTEHDTVYFHRSWTGVCVYEVKIARCPTGWIVVQVVANRDPTQYSCTDNEYDSRLLRYLFDVLLLERPSTFPAASGSPAVVQQWASVGRAMFKP